MNALNIPRVFQTERLVLRPFAPTDAPALVTALNDPNMACGLATVPHPYTAQDAAAYLDMVGTSALAICHEGALIGAVGLGAQLGYWIAEDYWGEGFATEAAKPLIDHHFASSDVPIRSSYVDDNEGSASVLRKLGFIIVGAEPIHILSRGRSVPGTAVVLTRKLWALDQ